MNYNEVAVSEVSTCSSQGSAYCLEWSVQKVSTYNVFDLLILIALPVLFFYLVSVFYKRRRRH